MGDRSDGVTPSEQPALTDGVVWLTPFHVEDAVAIGEFNRDDEHRRWFDQPPVDDDPAERRAHGEDVARRWVAAWATGEQLAFAVRSSEAGETIGVAELRPLPDETANISYAIRPEWRRHGYATRAVRLLADAGLTLFGYRRIELRCDPDNTASRTVAESAGFTFERADVSDVFEHADEWRGTRRDELVYGLDAPHPDEATFRTA